jgi:hypothetical protein
MKKFMVLFWPASNTESRLREFQELVLSRFPEAVAEEPFSRFHLILTNDSADKISQAIEPAAKDPSDSFLVIEIGTTFSAGNVSTRTLNALRDSSRSKA